MGKLFASVKEMAKTDKARPIHSIFDGILSCPLCAAPNGPNDVKTFKSANHANIQHWIMLVPMPSERVYSEYINNFLKQFQHLYQQTYIQSAYKSGVAGITTHPALMSQVSEKGNYWNVLVNVTEKEVISQTFNSLTEVLMDFTIKEVISTMFDVKKDPNTWTDDIKAYAFGN